MNPAMTFRTTLLVATMMAFAGCGDDGSADAGQTPPPPVTVTIGGTVSGLTGTLVLRNNGGDPLTMTSDGAFTFPTSLDSGVAYAVSVATQPEDQVCTVTNGTGTTAAADITNVAVNCSVAAVPAPSALSYPGPQTYPVGVAITPLNPTVTGTVTGYEVSPALPAGLKLDSTTGQILGTPTAASAAADYVITAANSGGTTTFTLVITVTQAEDFVIGGTVTGLHGAGLVLRNNGGDDLPVATSGTVAFASHLASGEKYSVKVKRQPILPGQICTVTNGTGTVGVANVTDIAINCVGSTFADADRDGLTDEIEATLGTDPAQVDSDGDSLGDGEEVLLRGTDPLKLDTDGDDLSDGEEVANGLSPLTNDTDADGLIDGNDPYPWRADGDGDGVTDAREIGVGTDPLKRDTDDGGASDGFELAVGANPLNGGDDPISADADGDGLSNGEEAALGTDPNDADTDGDIIGDFNDAQLCDALDVDTDSDQLDDLVDLAVGAICDQADSDHDGLVDGDEIGPTAADQDSDGLIDGVEERVYHSFSGVQDTDIDGLEDAVEVNVHRTDPASADTDCDGINDGLEVSGGTDPLQGPSGSTCSL